MRNQLAIQVLNRDMLYLMKCYQETLPNPKILASSIQLLEHTSQLVDIFCTKNKPVSSMDSPQFATMRKVLDFFNSWEETINKSVMYIGSKNLITRGN